MPYSADAAERVIQFCETYGVHSKGTFAGQRLKLLPFQRDEIIKPLFGTLRDDGYRQYREALIFLPAKQGKSFLTSAIALYMLMGDGEPGAEVYLAACDRQQAGIVFTNVASFVRANPDLNALCNIVDSSKRIIFHDRILRVLSSDSDSAMGYNASCVVADELAFWRSRELYDALRSRMRFRKQPLFISITTASGDQYGVAHELYDHAKSLKAGIAKDPTFFSYIRECPADADISDPRNWKLANPALGSDEEIARGEALLSMSDMAAEYQKAVQIPSQMASFRMLYLNQWVSAGDGTRFIELPQWDACGEPLRDLEGRPCYAGLDLSSTTDLTALSLVFPADDGSFDVLPFFWMPADNVHERRLQDRVPYDVWIEQEFLETTPGNVIDYGFIVERVRQLAEQYEIRELAFDRWGAQAVQHQLAGLGLTVFPFGQGYASMSSPTKEFQRLILSRQIRHGAHPVLRWNADNARIVNDPAGNIKITKPDTRKNFKRVDGAIATVMGLSRASLHQTSSGDAFAWVTGLNK